MFRDPLVETLECLLRRISDGRGTFTLPYFPFSLDAIHLVGVSQKGSSVLLLHRMGFDLSVNRSLFHQPGFTEP